MEKVEWHLGLVVGHDQIDREHRALVETLKQLHAPELQQGGSLAVETSLRLLKDQTKAHFESEEALMVAHDYPGSPAHIEAHRDLLQQVGDLIADFRSGHALLTKAVLAFLETWLVEHIVGKDKDLGDFLKRQAAETES